jgi:hypothetical protein
MPCEIFGCGDRIERGESLTLPASFQQLVLYSDLLGAVETTAGFGGAYERSGRTLNTEVVLAFAYAEETSTRIAFAEESLADIGKPSERFELRGFMMESDSLTASNLLYWDTQTRSLESVALSGMDDAYEEHFGQFQRSVRILDSSEDSEIRRVVTALDAPPTGDVQKRLRDDQSLVVSGSTLQAFVIGGLNRANNPRGQARVWDLETNSWTKVALDNGARIGEVLAATYNPHDGFVYAWSVAAGGTTQISRWEPGSSHFDLVAELSGIWNGFNQHWFSVGYDGSLAMVGTRHDRTAVARLNLGENGLPVFAGVATLDANIEGRPVVTPTHVIVAVADGLEPIQTPLDGAQFRFGSDWKFDVACE